MEPKGRARARKKAADPGAPPPSLGGQVCDFIEFYGVHPSGDHVGQTLKLHRDLEMMVWQAYELVRETHGLFQSGERVLNEVVAVGPKDIGKSTTAAAVGMAEAFGPVSFDGWDANGDPVGRPLDAVRIVIAGTEENQSGNTYEPLTWMIGPDTCSDNFRADFGAVDIGRHVMSSTRTILPNYRGEIIKATAGAASKEGGKATFAVLEEPHLMLHPELHNLIGAFRRALIKRRDAWILHSTNMYDPSAGSVLQKLHEAIESGSEETSRWVGNHLRDGQLPANQLVRELPQKELIALLKQIYGSAWGFVNQRAIVSYCRSGLTPDADARRYALNLATTAAGKWMPHLLWQERMSAERLKPGDQIALGFDGSRYRDACALVACRLRDRLVQPIKIWERPEGQKEWEAPAGEIDNEVATAFKTYDVKRMYCDPPLWRAEIDKWALEHSKDVVAEFHTSRHVMFAALDRWDVAVASGQMSHVGDPDLSRHVLNAEKALVRENYRLEKPAGVDPDSQRAHIDAAVAAVVAHEAACDAVALGLDKPKNRAPRLWV